MTPSEGADADPDRWADLQQRRTLRAEATVDVPADLAEYVREVADRRLALSAAEREAARFLRAEATREEIMRDHLHDVVDVRITFRLPDGEVLTPEGTDDE